MTTNTPTTYKKNELDTHKKDDSKFDVIHFLQKGVYDINFCIHMLRQIQDHTDKYKFSSGADLALSLSYTLKKMIAHLEIERDSQNG